METPVAPPPTLHERIDEILGAFERQPVTGVESPVRYRFDLTGDEPISVVLAVTPEGIRREEAGGDADVTVKLSMGDFVRIADGSFDGQLAVRSERIEIDGSLEQAAKLLEIVAGAEEAA
jgi:putative sterol carrier protein